MFLKTPEYGFRITKQFCFRISNIQDAWIKLRCTNRLHNKTGIANYWRLEHHRKHCVTFVFYSKDKTLFYAVVHYYLFRQTACEIRRHWICSFTFNVTLSFVRLIAIRREFISYWQKILPKTFSNLFQFVEK